MSSTSYPKVSPFRVAWKKCCPRCGKGRLFERFLKLTPKCPHCGLDLSRADTADGPAIFIMMILGVIISIMMVVIEFQYAPPIWLHMLIATAICFLGSFLLLPYFKGLLVALQYHTQSGDCTENRIED